MPVRPWKPRAVLVTASAREWPHGRAIADRCRSLGIPVQELPTDRLNLAFPDDPRQAYTQAKQTLAVTVAPPSKRRLQPIAPSADWRIDLAEGCPAHCSYCYLAGSLKGPPVTRTYANLPEIFAEIAPRIGEGTVTSRSRARAAEGTTFEASCYTDPLALEHLTGSLHALIEHIATVDGAALRFTSKFAAVEPLLGIEHASATRMRASVNPPAYARHEAGTAPVADRLAALARMAAAGYRVGLTVAPIIAASGWETAYEGLFAMAGEALRGVPDITIELITHRFTETSREVLTSWYPGSSLDMDPANRTEKRTKFGAVKHVYDAATMKDLRATLEAQAAHHLPGSRVLYFT